MSQPCAESWATSKFLGLLLKKSGVSTVRQGGMAKGGSTVDPAEVQRLLPVGLDTFDHLATMVAVVEPDGQCMFVNAAFEEILGLSRRAVLRESIYDWFKIGRAHV